MELTSLESPIRLHNSRTLDPSTLQKPTFMQTSKQTNSPSKAHAPPLLVSCRASLNAGKSSLVRCRLRFCVDWILCCWWMKGGTHLYQLWLLSPTHYVFQKVTTLNFMFKLGVLLSNKFINVLNQQPFSMNILFMNYIIGCYDYITHNLDTRVILLWDLASIAIFIMTATLVFWAA